MSINWAKVVACPTSWIYDFSYSSVSENGLYVYSINSYDSHILYYTLSSSTGDPINTGLKRQISSESILDDIQEMNQYLIVIYRHSGGSFNVDFIDPISCIVINQFSFQQIIHGVSKASIHGKEYAYFSGTKNSKFYMSKYYATDIGEYDDFLNQPITWTTISGNYEIENVSNPIVIFITKSVSNSSSTNLNTNDFSPDSIEVILLVDDFYKAYSENNYVLIELSWA